MNANFIEKTYTLSTGSDAATGFTNLHDKLFQSLTLTDCSQLSTFE